MAGAEISLYALLTTLAANPEVEKHLDFDGCFQFIELIQLLKPTLSLHQPPGTEQHIPLTRLPMAVLDFFEVCFDIKHESAKVIWEALCPIAWNLGAPSDMQAFGRRYLQYFLDYGRSRGLAFFHFMPPVRTCLDPRCDSKSRLSKKYGLPYSRELAEENILDVTVFTQDFGPIPGLSSSFSCQGCSTRYYANYYVDSKESRRTYYQEPFEFIHTGTHLFIETRTLDLFTTMMLISWTSAENCARIYNDGIGKTLSPCLPILFEMEYHTELDVEDVWDGVMLHWLLEDADERQGLLQLEEKAPSQGKRLQPALHARNLRMAGPGQECWNHGCNLCCWIQTLPDGTKIKNRFCPRHADQDLLCVVTTCSEHAEEGHQTCSLKEHRELENFNSEKNKAMFQLKERLARLRTSQPRESIPDASDVIGQDEEVLIDNDGVCDRKPEEGNRTVRARFGRRRTHNEGLCVASCGVILGRATFYGSEAPNDIVLFWKRLFPTRRSLPAVLWHDNNCQIVSMLNNPSCPDNYFEFSALPVDIFHFKYKHKKSDEKCNDDCNPVNWSELFTPEGTWRFNSSAAEQANAWIGGYQAIVREMQADRYEFFLDEMIKRRNRIVIRDLDKKEKEPKFIPRETLLRPETPEIVG